MTPEIEINPEAKETVIFTSKETKNIQSAGIAVLILGIDPYRNGDNSSDPLLWTIKELKEKPSTMKKAGEISIPAETRKIGEIRSDNILGALAEFCDDTNLKYIKKHLFLKPGSFGERVINVSGNLVDLTALIYDGDLSLPITPVNFSEVSPNGWLKVSQIRNFNDIRPILSQALEKDLEIGLSKDIFDTYLNGKDELAPVFEDDFSSIADFYRNRETLSDIPLLSRTTSGN